MDDTILATIFLGAIILISTALILIGLRVNRDYRISKAWMILALTPSFLLLVLFWSLAIHMRHALGGWPLGIGFSEFEGPLLFHAQLACNFFFVFAEYSIWIWPAICIVSAIVPRLRRNLLYAGLYSAGFTMVTVLMFTAPSGFQHWWWD